MCDEARPPDQEPWASNEEPDPQEEAALARHLFEEGELPHAATHLSWALAFEPERGDWLELFREIVAAAEDPLTLAELGDETPFHVAAARCLILKETGALASALELLFQVMAARPDLRYEAWALNWNAEDPEALPKVPPPFINHFLGRWMDAFSEHAEDPAWVERMTAAMPRLIEVIQEAHPGETAILTLASGVLRRLDLLDEAMKLNERAYEREPCWQTAVGVAITLRQKGDTERARSFYEKALGYDPEDLSARLDLGDMFLDEAEWQSSLGWYEQVIEREPEHPWAGPSRLYVRWIVDSDEEQAEELAALARDNPENQRAKDLWGRVERHRSAFVTWLPEPASSLVNLVRELLENRSEDKPLSLSKLTATSLEAPSARRACNLELARADLNPLPPLKVSGLQVPDPRRPLEEVDFIIWDYDDMEPRPAVERPGEAVQREIRELAKEPFHVEAWWSYSKSIARRLGVAARDELLGILVYPPDWGPDERAWDWMPRIQVAAVLVCAQLDEGWEGSLRRETLRSLLFGPMDWTTSAAIIALAQVIRKVPESREDIESYFARLWKTLTDSGPLCYDYALACHTLLLPELSGESRGSVLEMKHEIEHWRY